MITSLALCQIRPLLKPQVPHFLDSVSQAITQWNALPPLFHVAMNRTARAGILTNLVYHFAAQHLGGAVIFKEDLGQRYMLFEDLVVVRVKLLDSQLRAHNYPTVRARNWVQRHPLPGIPVGRLHLGYRMDPTGSVLQDVFITLPNGDPRTVNDWVWQIAGPSVESFPLRQNLFGDEVFRYEVA